MFEPASLAVSVGLCRYMCMYVHVYTYHTCMQLCSSLYISVSLSLYIYIYIYNMSTYMYVYYVIHIHTIITMIYYDMLQCNILYYGTDSGPFLPRPPRWILQTSTTAIVSAKRITDPCGPFDMIPVVVDLGCFLFLLLSMISISFSLSNYYTNDIVGPRRPAARRSRAGRR